MDMANGSTTDYAAEIRAALKRAGYSGRDVSIKSDYYSMGSAIRIQIKNPRVPSKLVKALAEPAEDIRRDHFGDILSGGNRYVTISFSHEAEQALAAPYVEAVKAALAQLTLGNDRSLIPVEGVPGALVGLDNGCVPALWGKDGHIAACGSAEWMAFLIGEKILNHGEVCR